MLRTVFTHIAAAAAGAGALFVINITVLDNHHDDLADMIRHDKEVREDFARKDYEARHAQAGMPAAQMRTSPLKW